MRRATVSVSRPRGTTVLAVLRECLSSVRTQALCPTLQSRTGFQDIQPSSEMHSARRTTASEAAEPDTCAFLPTAKPMERLDSYDIAESCHAAPQTDGSEEGGISNSDDEDAKALQNVVGKWVPIDTL